MIKRNKEDFEAALEAMELCIDDLDACVDDEIMEPLKLVISEYKEHYKYDIEVLIDKCIEEDYL
jgi:hypothetical protein